MGKRDENIEMLRSLSCLAVVVLHINAWCFQIDNLDASLRTVNAIINTLVRFAVPCFMMITGTYVFRNADKNGWKAFYKNAVKKVVLPTVVFSVFCVTYVALKGVLDNQWLLKKALVDWLHGIPFGHMWYMYMLIGFYAVVPILCLIRKKVSRFCWGMVGILCIILSALRYDGNLLAPIWPFCWVQYAGYFIIGDLAGGGKKSKRQLGEAIFVSIVSLLLMCSYSIKEVYSGIRFDFQPQNILTAIFSVSVYLIFKNKEPAIMNDVVGNLAKQSANIYYLHGIVINIVVVLMNRFQLQYKYPVLFLFVTVIIVTFCCYYVGFIWDEYLYPKLCGVDNRVK